MLTFNRPDHRLVVCPYADHVSILVYPAGAEHPTEHITLRADELGRILQARRDRIAKLAKVRTVPHAELGMDHTPDAEPLIPDALDNYPPGHDSQS